MPEVTDIAQLDAAGREQIAVSRLDTDKINSGKGRFAAMVHQRAQAVIVAPDPLFRQQGRQRAELAERHRLPSMLATKELVEAGGLMSYGQDYVEHYRRAATYVDKILKGANPADLPIELPTKFELIIYINTAKALGLTIPQSLLLRADEVIQ